VKRKITALIPISLLFITCTIIPVSAFYFDFQYFETDKLVYEVGETIDMVTKLIADFSDEGWCYISFAIVTDLGPSFADEYFIPPSPIVRFLNSAYTILPEDTAPGIIGAQAFALFTVEIFDTVSQSAGDNIEITINRGHLATTPLSPLSVQYGQNNSLQLKIASIHNDNVVYSNQLLNLLVKDFNSQTVLDSNITTTSEGILHLNWSDSLGGPGFYNLTVSSYGNEDFLPFTNSFQITVLSAPSNLTIISSPESVYCQSPDGNHIQQAEIIVEHTDLDSMHIDNSIVQWTTSFGSGIMTNLGNGRYSNMIPFNTCPGSYQINITATNVQYQIAETTTIVNVLANPLQFSAIQPYWNVTRGNNVTVEFFIESALDWNQSIQLQFIDETKQLSLTSIVQSNISSFLTIQVFHNMSIGYHAINISSVSEYYQFVTTPQIILIVFGTINANVLTEQSYYGETLEFNLELLDDNNQFITLVDISISCDEGTTPFAITGYINPSLIQSVSLPMWISPGTHNFTFTIESQYFNTITFSIPIKVWMRTNITIVITRNNDKSNIHYQLAENSQDLFITRRISSGSIMSPPPILFRGITSTRPPTARFTSPTI
jgi:hypothetical protein